MSHKPTISRMQVVAVMHGYTAGRQPQYSCNMDTLTRQIGRVDVCHTTGVAIPGPHMAHKGKPARQELHDKTTIHCVAHNMPLGAMLPKSLATLQFRV